MRCVSSLEARDPGLRAILSRYLFQRGTGNLRSRQLSIFYRSKNLLFLETLLEIEIIRMADSRARLLKTHGVKRRWRAGI